MLRNDVVLRKNCECVELPVRLDLKSQPVGPFKSKFTVRTDSADKTTAELDVDLEAMIVEAKTPWLPSVFVQRLERGETVERPLTNDGANVDCSALLSTYDGDRSIQIDLVRPSPDGKAASPPRIRIGRPHDSTASGLARGTLILRTAGSMEESVTPISIAVFLPR